MAAHRSIHDSYWLRSHPLMQRFDCLPAGHNTEILVVGGGITGLSIALELLSKGRRVTVCEANVIGGGATGGSSGHLDAHPEMGPQKLIDQLGEEKGRQYVRLRLEAIDTIQERADEACDFRRVPAYFYSEDPDSKEKLQTQCSAAVRLGLDATFVSSPPLKHAQAGYRIEGLARIHCMAYLRRLTDLVVEAGGDIFENSLVEGAEEDAPKSLKAGAGSVNFEHVVFAVHCNYTSALRLYLQTPAYQSYVMAARIHDELEDALYWDDRSPYFYTRRAHSDDASLILVGGCDHRTGQGDACAARGELENYLRSRFDVQEIVSSWSSELFEPSDGLPIIGKVPGKQNMWIVTGLSGVGLTWGTAAGKVIAAQLTAPGSMLSEALSPSRFGLSSAGKIIAEQALTVKNLSERVLPAAAVTPAELSPGQGAVGKVDGQHVAVCRDRDGCEHRHSPICTHMGGVVHWNEVEQTWDCGVHGGRFAADGARLYGPPQEDLKEPG